MPDTSTTSKLLSVAIDGPAGAGKSTTARALAARLGYAYIDSGAMYRALALRCRQQGVEPGDEAATAAMARALEIDFAPAATPGAEQRVRVAGEDVTEAIRTPAISQLASAISAQPAVREALVAEQRAMGARGGVVMEGRDIGTVVLPEAGVKVFLTASLRERARRRYDELLRRGASHPATLEQVEADIAERDARDTQRAVSPLVAAPDAVTIDSEHLSSEGVVDAILELCAARLASE